MSRLTDIGAAQMAMLAMKGGDWFVSARWPADSDLYGGLYHTETAATPEEAIDQWVVWFEQQWSGL